jgi:GT2 family glycosyltransferase
MMAASILVIIVNYRTAALTIDAVTAIMPEATSRGDVQAIIVDNGSNDGSASRIADAITTLGASGWCSLLALDDNRGFAGANNAAIAYYQRTAQPDHVWLINPDTIAQPDAIGALIRFLDSHPDAGIVGGRCLWPDGRPRLSAFRFPSPIGELVDGLAFGPLSRLLRRYQVAIEIPDKPIAVDWVSGSHLMIRGAVVRALGPMDEGYFLYFEETAYCAKAADAGFACYHVPDSRVVHIGGQSTGVTGEARKSPRPRYWFASRARFMIGRYGKAQTHIANLLWLLAWPPGRMLARLRGRAEPAPPGLWCDFVRVNYGVGGLMYGDRAIS